MTASLVSASPAAPGAGYAPGDVVYLAGGSPLPGAAIKITDTTAVAIAIAAAGSGGTTGTQIITGTTGAGQRFTASVVVAGGAMTGTPVLLFPGDYTTNPTVIAAEPVTGGGLVGASVSLTMGALAAQVTLAGSYTEAPASPVGQLYSSGLGTGATWTAAWSGVTPAIFRANFPSFADSVAYPSAAVNFWLTLGVTLLPAGRLGQMLDFATQLFIAHNLTLEAINAAAAANGAPPGMSRGIISSESAAGASVSFDTSSGIPMEAGHWNLTTFGTMLIQRIRIRGMGPLQIGIGSGPVGSGRAWAGPPTWVPQWFTT